MSTMLPAELLIILGLVLDVWFIRTERAGDLSKATLRKGLASLVFVALGFYCLAMAPSLYGAIIVIGLVCGLIGDVLLNLRLTLEAPKSNQVFAAGVVAFVLGHLLYIAALLMQGASIWIWLLITVVIAAISVPLFMRDITAPSAGLRAFGIVYLIIVIAMFGAATSLTITTGGEPLADTFAVGAALFMVSDFMMIYHFFGPRKIPALRTANLLCYYVGQLLIALTILMA